MNTTTGTAIELDAQDIADETAIGPSNERPQQLPPSNGRPQITLPPTSSVLSLTVPSANPGFDACVVYRRDVRDGWLSGFWAQWLDHVHEGVVPLLPVWDTATDAVREALANLCEWLNRFRNADPAIPTIKGEIIDLMQDITAGKVRVPIIDLPKAPGVMPPATPPAETIPPPPVLSPEGHFRLRMQATMEELCQAALERFHAEAALKAARERERDALDALDCLRKQGPEKYPLLDPSPSPAAVAESPVAPEDAVAQPPDDAASPVPYSPPVEAWRAVPLGIGNGGLGLPPGIRDILADAGVMTFGALVDSTADGTPLTAFPKIGKAKAAIIQAACDAYWAANPREEAA